MKRYLVLLCLLFAGVARAQTFIPVSSFLGVPFGATEEAAQKKMLNGGVLFDPRQSKKGSYVFSNVKYGGLTSDHAFLRFINDKFYEGGIFFKGERSRAIELYHAVVRSVVLTYGEGKEKTTGNYFTGDGNELDVLEAGTGLIVTTWIEDPQNNKYNTIEVSMEPDLAVLLKFTDIKTAGKKKK